MVEAAIASGKEETVAAVIAIARQTNPDDADELDAIQEAFDKRQQELAAKDAEARQVAIRSAGLFERWSGKGQIGAFQSSGNSSNVGVSLALALTRDGLAQYESDRFQGYSSRYSASGGLGYRVIDKSDLQLSVKAGPAWRQTDFVDGRIESKLAALIGMDFDWAITDRISLTQDTNMVADAGGSATAIIDSANTSLNLVTGMEAKISDALTTRLSYTLEYDSNPPAGSVSTDTLTRFTLVYGF
jgi:putative salt-induced outer membrane protein